MYTLYVKLTVYYIVGFTCNILFLNSAYFIFNQFKSNKFFACLLLLGILCFRCMDIPPPFSAMFSEGDNFRDFLFACLEDEGFPK